MGSNGVLCRFDGVVCQPLDSGTRQSLMAIWRPSPDELLLFGMGGTIPAMAALDLRVVCEEKRMCAIRKKGCGRSACGPCLAVFWSYSDVIARCCT